MSQTTATAQPISPLRRRMTEDMTVRGFGEKTQIDYIRHVKNFTIFLGRSPDLAEGEDLRAFQVHQREQGVQPPTMNGAVAALRFFFTTTCGRPEMARHLRLVKQPQKLRVVLTPEEVLLLLKATPGPKYKAALGVAYGAGLRVSEVSNLKVSDIDSKRMVLRVEQGKGKKDRNGMLSPRLLRLLREWWCVGQPTTWLFPGRDPLLPINDAPALSGRSRDGGGGRDREASVAAHPQAQLRHASSGARCRYSRDPGGSGPFEARLCPVPDYVPTRCRDAPVQCKSLRGRDIA
jgi:integrase/recombinase XerD